MATSPGPARCAGRIPSPVAGDFRQSQDIAFIESLIGAVRDRSANLLICLHDRKRYDPSLVAAIEALAQRYDFVELHFKDEHPDNLADLVIADIMLSNLSSFLSYFYLFCRPAIHIWPIPGGLDVAERIVMFLSRIRLHAWVRYYRAWMTDPRDVAGPVVRNAAEAVLAIGEALAHPEGAGAIAEHWLSRKVVGRDGHTAARLKAELEKLCRQPVTQDRALFRTPIIPTFRKPK